MYTGDSYNDLFGGFRQLQGSYDVVNASLAWSAATGRQSSTCKT